MKKLILLLLLLIPLVLVMTSCKKEKEDEKKFPYRPVPQIVRDYAWFENGSYWIYEDSVTKQLDSIYVYGTNVYTNRDFDQNTPLTDFELLTVYAKSAQTDSKYEFHMGTYSDLKTNSLVIIYKSPIHSDSSRRSEVLNHPFLLYKVFQRPTGAFTLVDSLSSYSVLGQTYSNVKVYYNESDGIMEFDSTLTWVAPNVGIIKKQGLGSIKTSLLKKSHIKKK